MIARTWRGWTRTADVDAYVELIAYVAYVEIMRTVKRQRRSDADRRYA